MGEWSSVTALEEPILELEAHLTGAFQPNNSKVEVSKPTKKRGYKPLKVEKARVDQSGVITCALFPISSTEG